MSFRRKLLSSNLFYEVAYIHLTCLIEFCMKTPFEERLTVCFVFILLGMSVIGITSYQSNKAFNDTSKSVIHTYKVLLASTEVLSDLKDIQIAARGYMLTTDTSFVATLLNANSLVFKDVDNLKHLTKDNPNQQIRIDSLIRLINKRKELSLQTVELTEDSKLSLISKLRITYEAEKLMNQTRDLIDEIQNEENRLLIGRSNANLKSEKLLNFSIYLFLIAAIIFLVLAFFTIKNHLVYRKKTQEEIQDLNESLEKRVIETTKEIFEKEERYHFVLDHMQEGIQIIDYDWKYFYVNDALTKQGKYSKEELLGNTMMSKYPGIENTEMFKNLQFSMKKRIAQRVENEFVFPDGTIGYYDLSIQPVPEGIFILSMDITQRKRIELDKEQYILELEKLLYKISHEVRHPVVQILGISELLDRSLVPEEEINTMVESIKQSAIILDSYTRDLTAFVTVMKNNSQASKQFARPA